MNFSWSPNLLFFAGVVLEYSYLVHVCKTVISLMKKKGETKMENLEICNPLNPPKFAANIEGQISKPIIMLCVAYICTFYRIFLICGLAGVKG